MIETIYRGALGDRIFQYCFGRILSERWGMEFIAGALPGFPGTVRRQAAGVRYFAPLRCWSGLAVEDRQTSALIRDAELESPPEGRLLLFGWFHRWELYRGYWPQVSGWLDAPEAGGDLRDGDLAVVMRFQRPEAWGEASIHSGAPPQWGQPVPSVKDISRLVERLRPERLVIFSDRPGQVNYAAFGGIRAEVRPYAGMSAWNSLRGARRMLIPAGHATDWWAARLSGAGEIYVCDPWAAAAKACPQEYG